MEKYLLYSDGIYYGAPYLMGERTVMSTKIVSEAPITWENELEEVTDVLQEAKISVTKTAVSISPSKGRRMKNADILD